MNKYTCNSSKSYALKVDAEYPKQLRELHNYYPLAPDKKLVPNFFDKKSVCASLWKLKKYIVY